MKQTKYRAFNIDCLQYLPTLKDSCVDLILTDPPYNIAKYSTGNIQLFGRTPLNNDIAEWDEIEINPFDYVKDFKRILKPSGNIFIFSGYNQFGKWHEAFDNEFDSFNMCVWHKTNPPPKIYKNGFVNSTELIVCLWNKGHKWNFLGQEKMHNVLNFPLCSGAERLKNPKHPTQKPLALLKYLIEVSTVPGDIVFDPFMGVGSSGVAALDLGRRFGGCEINTEYFEAASKRLENI